MTDEPIETPNFTATEIANAKHPVFPVHGIIGDMVERELTAIAARGIIPHQRLTPAECLALWVPRD